MEVTHVFTGLALTDYDAARGCEKATTRDPEEIS